MACFNAKAGVIIVDSLGVINSGRCLILSSTCAYGSNEINFAFDRVNCTRKIAGTGACKIAIGYAAGYTNSGASQIAIGRFALVLNSGSCNVAVGDYAMQGSGAGSNNTAVGFCASTSITTGNRNIGIGVCAGLNLTTGSDNIAIGYGSGRCITGASASVAIGVDSFANCTSGNRAVAVGHYAEASTYGSTAIGNRSIAIGIDSAAFGYNAYINGKGTRWGNAGITCNCVYGTWSTISDGRDKADIIDLDENLGINFIRKLRPVKYKNDSRTKYVTECGFEFGEKDGTLKSVKTHYGFIAQEIKQAANELGFDFEGVHYNILEDRFALQYEELLSPIIKSIKQIDIRVQILKNKL